MLTIINKAVKTYSMIKGGEETIVALSGGADSVVLLHTLITLSEKLGIKVSACHLNHNLRGAESRRDEEFVRELCRKSHVHLYYKSAEILTDREKHTSIEEAARNARYTFFEEIGTGKLIATAHTAADNTETVLLNLIRGTALKGLCGIPPVRRNIIRPLIFCSREDIEEYCRKNSLDYVTDSSNLSDEYTRNKLRLNVIPLLKEINPSLNRGVTRMTEELRRDEDYLSNEALKIIEESTVEGGYRADILAKTPSAVLHRIISAVLSQNNISPSSLMIYGIEEILLIGGGKINIKKDTFAVVQKNRFFIEIVKQKYRYPGVK